MLIALRAFHALRAFQGFAVSCASRVSCFGVSLVKIFGCQVSPAGGACPDLSGGAGGGLPRLCLFPKFGQGSALVVLFLQALPVIVSRTANHLNKSLPRSTPRLHKEHQVSPALKATK